MHNVVSSAASALDRLYAMTKEGHLADPDRPLHIALLGLSSDIIHFDLAIDALRTFCPKAKIVIFSDDLLRLESQSDYPDLARADVRHYHSFIKRSPVAWDLLVLLHPRPFCNDEQMARLRPLMRVFRIGSLLHPFTKCVMLHRNLELWNASITASITRKLLLTLKIPVLALLQRLEKKVIQSKVFPYLPQSQSWNRPHACSHNNAVKLFSKPRPIEFCPDCGMGITPPNSLSRLDDASTCYGAGYALYGRYTGHREFNRSVRENNRRVNGYLENLGFPDSLEFPNAQTKARVLDYGCGNGRMFPLWHDNGYDYLGIDYSSTNIEFARDFANQFAPEASGKAEFICGTLDAQSIRDKGPFAMIFLSHVLEHVKDPIELLKALRRVALQEAFLYVEVPNAFTYTWSLDHRGYANKEHLWDFTPAMLERIARTAGWSDVRIHLDPDQSRNHFIALLARNRLHG